MMKTFVKLLSCILISGCVQSIAPATEQFDLPTKKFSLQEKNTLSIPFPFEVKMPIGSEVRYDPIGIGVDIRYIKDGFTAKDISLGRYDIFAGFSVIPLMRKDLADSFEYVCNKKLSQDENEQFTINGLSGRTYAILKFQNCGPKVTTYFIENLNQATYAFTAVNQKGLMGEKIVDEAIISMTVLDE